MDHQDETHSFSALQLAAFSSPAIPMFGLAMPLVVYVPQFYAQELGLGLGLVGMLVTVGKLFDVITDPLIGSISDRLDSRFGRRRPMLVVSVPILMLATWRVFFPPADAGGAYLFGWLLVLYAGWTLATTALFSWGAELEEGYDERTRVMGWIQVANVFGQTAVLTLPTLVAYLAVDPAGLAAKQLASMGWFVIVLLPLTVAVALARVPERPAAKGPPVGWRVAFILLARNIPLRWLLAADFLAGLAVGVTGSLSLFFVGHVLGLPQLGSAAMLLSFGGGLVLIPFWVKLSGHFSKHRALAYSSLYSVVAIPLVLLLAPAGLVWTALLGFVAVGAGSAATQLFTRAMMADVIDVDRVESGTDRTGLFMALMGTTVKLGIALGPGLSFQLLAWIGFETGGGNGPSTLLSFRFLMAGLVMAIHAGLVACVWNFPLDRRRHDALQDRLHHEPSNA